MKLVPLCVKWCGNMCVIIALLCITEIVTTSGSHYLSVNSLEERDQWAESIKKASVCRKSIHTF